MIEDYNRGLVLYDETGYSINSTDNQFIYDNIITSVEDKSLITSKIGLRCSITGLNVLLVAGGGTTGVHERCYFVEEQSIYICVGDTVFCIDNGSFKLKWKVKVDEASCFQIIQLTDFLLIHGKLSITAMSNEGEIIWRFYGKDIFVTPDGTAEIELLNGNLKVVDWNLDEYLLDRNGNLICN